MITVLLSIGSYLFRSGSFRSRTGTLSRSRRMEVDNGYQVNGGFSQSELKVPKKNETVSQHQNLLPPAHWSTLKRRRRAKIHGRRGGRRDLDDPPCQPMARLHGNASRRLDSTNQQLPNNLCVCACFCVCEWVYIYTVRLDSCVLKMSVKIWPRTNS